MPHIKLEHIAKNPEIDRIAEKYQPDLEGALSALNHAVGQKFEEWEVPRESLDDWSREAKAAHAHFWETRRKRQQEIDESIDRNSPQEVLYYQPGIDRSTVRVAGPFTVEAIPIPSVESPDAVEATVEAPDAAKWLETALANLGVAGLVFPGGKRLDLTGLRRIDLGFLHAEAEVQQNGSPQRVALTIGSQYGPVTGQQVIEAVQTAIRNAYDMLVAAGLSFDSSAHDQVQKGVRIPVHFAYIAPDTNETVGSLLKTTKASQLFTVFGQPDVAVERQSDDTYVASLRGVDTYDPVTNQVHSSPGSTVAAWFLDTDYDGFTFHICQAYFPADSGAWEKLQRALKASIDPEAFERMRGTESFPFEAGEHKRCAVKVIDLRGNEVVRVLPLG